MKFTMLLAVTGCIVFKTAVFAQGSSDRGADPGAEQTPSGTVPFTNSSSPPPGTQMTPETGAAQEQEPEQEESLWTSVFEKSSFAEQISAARQSALRARKAADEARESAAAAVVVESLYKSLAKEAQNKALKTVQLHNKKMNGDTSLLTEKQKNKSQDSVNQDLGRAVSAEHQARTAENKANRAVVKETALEAEALSREAHVAFLEVQAMEESREVPENQKARQRDRVVLLTIIATEAESRLKRLCQSSFDSVPQPLLSVEGVINDFPDL